MVFKKIKEFLRDKTMDDFCNHLQQIGVDAKMVERNQNNKVVEDIECGAYGTSLGIIEISEGNIRWINTIKKTEGPSTSYIIKYVIPAPLISTPPSISKR